MNKNKTVVVDKAKKYDFVNPDHYKKKSVETIEKIRRIYGDACAIIYCELNAFKYRDRIGLKPDQPIEQEMEKIRWYENKANELRGLLSKEETNILNTLIEDHNHS